MRTRAPRGVRCSWANHVTSLLRYYLTQVPRRPTLCWGSGGRTVSQGNGRRVGGIVLPPWSKRQRGIHERQQENLGPRESPKTREPERKERSRGDRGNTPWRGRAQQPLGKFSPPRPEPHVVPEKQQALLRRNRSAAGGKPKRLRALTDVASQPKV